MVSTEGDYFSELINKEALGLTVPAEDPAALASALAELLENQSLAQICRERAYIVRDQYRWANVLRPLLEFCTDPCRARDLNRASSINPVATTGKMSLGKAVRHSRHYYHSGGIERY